MIYNTTNMTNANNIVGLFNAINGMSGGWLTIMILILAFVITFITMKAYPTKVAFAGSSFIITVIALLMRAIDMVGDVTLAICIFLTAGGVIALLLKE